MSWLVFLACDIIQVYCNHRSVITTRAALEEKLEENGYDSGPNVVRAVQRALKLDWDHGNIDHFVKQLQKAMKSVSDSRTG